MSEETKPEKEYTPEEIEKMRRSTIKYYENQNEVLKHQAEFEEYQARIAKSQAETMMYRIKIATMAMGPKLDKQGEEDGEGSGEKKREEATAQTSGPQLKIEKND